MGENRAHLEGVLTTQCVAAHCGQAIQGAIGFRADLDLGRWRQNRNHLLFRALIGSNVETALYVYSTV